LAFCAAARGAAGFFPDFQDEGEQQRPEIVLDGKKVPPRTKEKVPGLGVSGRKAVLVYQRNHLRRGGSEGLEGKDEALPEM